VILPTSAAAAGASTELRLESPQRYEIARAAAISDAALGTAEARTVAMSSSYWGGNVTASTGDAFQIFASDSYPQDPATTQRWADFIAGLEHGPELSQLTMYLAPLTEVQSICGRSALACYNDTQSLLVAPGENPSSDTSAEAVVTHEYGHHVAAHRSDAPWAAIDYGTKRWASYGRVCARTRTGELHPGAEQAPYYQYNPGEWFAESYRVLNERRAGLAEAPWDVVADNLYPSDEALTLLEQDVLSPWRQRTSSTLAGKGRRSYSIATSLDGTLTVTMRGKGRLTLLAGRTRVASAGASGTVRTTVCGTRAYTVRVAGTGAFRLTVTKP
jgi:hypothetical protein